MCVVMCFFYKQKSKTCTTTSPFDTPKTNATANVYVLLKLVLL